MTVIKSLIFSSVLLGLTACASLPNNAAKTVLAKSGDQYNISAPINSFSDFILIETQMGNVAPRVVDIDTVIADLASYDAIFIGEAHGHAASHYVQSRIFSGLHAIHPDIALSMEQFDRPHQAVIDDYLAGKIGEETLIHDADAWPHYRSSYRPMVEFAKANNLAIIAAEAPKNMVACVGREGAAFLDRLKGEPRTWIASELNLEDGAYKDKFYGFMSGAVGHHGGGSKMSEAAKQKKMALRYAAQVSRDDTMAESIALHMQANPGRKIVHINGSFHSAGLLGTPERLAAHIPGIKMANVHPIMVDDPKNPSFDSEDVGEGQYLLLIYPTPKRFVKMKNINAFIKRTKNKIGENRCAY